MSSERRGRQIPTSRSWTLHRHPRGRNRADKRGKDAPRLAVRGRGQVLVSTFRRSDSERRLHLTPGPWGARRGLREHRGLRSACVTTRTLTVCGPTTTRRAMSSILLGSSTDTTRVSQHRRGGDLYAFHRQQGGRASSRRRTRRVARRRDGASDPLLAQRLGQGRGDLHSQVTPRARAAFGRNSLI